MASDPTQTDGGPDGASYITPQDRDLMVRTVIGEAGNQSDLGRVAVAHVILNRVEDGKFGDSPAAVVLAPHQFEPWQTRAGELKAIPANSPVYQTAARAVDAAVSGDAPDPTGGATFFLNPDTVRARGTYQTGNGLPDWAQGQGQRIGAHVFFRGGQGQKMASAQTSSPDAMSDDDILGMLAGSGGAGTAAPTSGASPATASTSPSSNAIPAATGVPNGSGDVPAATDAATPPGAMRITVNPRAVAPAGPAQAQQPSDPAQMSDDDILASLTGGAGASQSPASGQTAVAAASAPANQPAPASGLARVAETGAAFAKGAMDLPIVGPAILGGISRVAAGADSLINGTPYADELTKAQGTLSRLGAEHPYAEMAGNLAGNVAALAPVAATGLGARALGIAGESLFTKGALGAGTGAVIGGADSGVRSGGNLAAAGGGAIVGGLAGGAAPIAGQVIGAGVNKLLGTGPVVSNVNKLLAAIHMSPDEAQATLTRMGPSATLADVDPALTTEAGALAARGGRSTSVLKGAMANRAANANDRVATLMDSALGPKPDLNAELDAALQRGQAAAKPHYDAARSIGMPVDVNRIIYDIDSRLNTAAGGEAKVLEQVRDFLLTKQGLPKVAPEAALKARQAIDDYAERLPQAETSAGRNAKRTLTDLRAQVDGVLKQNPDIALGDAAYAGEMKLRDAMKEGTELFQRGTRPEDFARRIQTAAPGEVDALRAGARVAIGDALEQARRGELAGARSLLGAGSANRAKLQMLFPKAGEVLDALQNEAAMRATETRVAGNSASAERIAAGARYQPPGSGANMTNDLMSAASGVALGDPSGGVATALARRGAGSVMNKLSAAKYDRLAEGTAERLAASGPARDEFMRRLAAGNGARRLVAPGANAGANLLLNATGADYRRRLAR